MTGLSHARMKVGQFIRLPSAISEHEHRYLKRANFVALFFYALHVPVLVAIAWLNDTGPLLAAVLALAVLAGPTTAYSTLENPRSVSVVHGVAGAAFGGLLVHVGQGPMQIEMHFYFFALLAVLVGFANPLVIVVTAVSVAMHHAVVWLWLPASVFNHDASFAVVVVHATFVVLESIAACFIARSMFDNVIGLERIILSRTRELDARNHDMRLVLDNVDQGFVTIDRSGRLCGERSRQFDVWFGSQQTDFFAILEERSALFAAETRLAWDALLEGFLPFDVLLHQMPKRLAHRNTTFDIAYLPLGALEVADRFLVVITDVTAQVNRDGSEEERREVFGLFEILLADRSGFEAYFEEATLLIHQVLTAGPEELTMLTRPIHTLKGNSAIFGLETVAKLCHQIESHIAEGSVPPEATVAALVDRWERLAHSFERLIGARRRVIELDVDEQKALEVEARALSPALWKRIRALRLEPTRRRLSHFAEQSKRIAGRLEKELVIDIVDGGLRLDPRAWGPFWNALVHTIRNAVDHGIELPEARLEAGKPSAGRLLLRTEVIADHFVVEVADDGAGIDWSAVERKALAAGHPAACPSDLEAALFLDGVSTADQVTDMSGRGVGMGALLEATRHAGGTVSVVSERGRGTSFRMSFPIAAMAPENAVAGPSGAHAVAA